MTFEDAAIAIYQEKIAGYRKRDLLWKKTCALRAAGEMRMSTHLVIKELLFRFWNAETGLCCPKVATLRESMETKCSRATIFRAFIEAEELGVMWRQARRFTKEVIENGRCVQKCVSASSQFHFAMDVALTFCISSVKAARKAAHQAKKAAVLIRMAQEKKREQAEEKACNDLFLGSESQNTSREPNTPYIGIPQKPSARLEAALFRLAAGVGKRNERQRS